MDDFIENVESQPAAEDSLAIVQAVAAFALTFAMLALVIRLLTRVFGGSGEAKEA
jgi:hypothetical protein